MDISNRNNKTTTTVHAVSEKPTVPEKEKRSIYSYNMMEQVDCDLDAAISNPNPENREHCRLIAESADYLFYSYMTYADNSGGCVIRRSKKNPAQTLYFGQNYILSCRYKNYLFQCDHNDKSELFFIYAKNIHTGDIIKCDWLGKGAVCVNINRYLRTYCQDTINSINVIDDILVFDITREQGDYRFNNNKRYEQDKYNIDTNYLLKVTFEIGCFKPVAFFGGEAVELEKTAIPLHEELLRDNFQRGEINWDYSTLGRDVRKHYFCQYRWREEDCPQVCEKCTFCFKRDGDNALAQNKIDKSITQYKKAVFVEPKYADAWVSMGIAYSMKSEYNNAISAYNKAISIDPTYGEALYRKAVALKKLGKLDEAIEIINIILELYDDSIVKDLV